jgi:wyosine [tRNA(Phe)-imidazoG37] synthetase (radical SAM superfamily)
LERQLIMMHDAGQQPDVLTFAGNGEPTSHPHFAEIIDDTIRLRDKWCPKAKISVLSNATFTARAAVREALMKVDNNILKLDTVDNDYIKKVNRPLQPSYDVNKIIDNLKFFNGHVIVQTMFMKGDGTDNTSDEYVLPWLKAVGEIKPESVMIYTIDRETPDRDLRKATPDELNRIRDRVIDMGIPCTASY